MIVQGLNDSKTVGFADGYDAANGVGITLINPGSPLGQGDYCVFVYTDNYWIQSSPFIGEISGSPDITPPSGRMAVSQDLTISNDEPQDILVQENIIASGQVEFEIPAGYRITSFIIQENGQAQEGLVKVGTAADKGDIIDRLDISGMRLVDCNLNKSLFSLEKSQKLYISNDKWNDSSLSLFVKIERVAY